MIRRPATLDYLFQAEHLDLGRERVVYHYLPSGNAGGAYHTDEEIDIGSPSYSSYLPTP